MTRILLVVLLLGLLGWCWLVGERTLRRRLQVPDPYEPVVGMFVGMWRLLMLAVTAVALISAMGLWWAQDAGDAAQAAADDLCAATLAWQRQAIEVRQADVRIAIGELADANQQASDARLAIVTATQTGLYDSPFVRTFLDAELSRADLRKAALEAESAERRSNLEKMQQEAIPGCPLPNGEE